MNKYELTEKDIKELIIYCINKNNIDTSLIDTDKINKIISNYYTYCDNFKSKYSKGQLDTFKKAACLLASINKNKLLESNERNSIIAIECATKMCEKPLCYVGKDFDIPHKMKEINIEEILENYEEAYNYNKEILIEFVKTNEKIIPEKFYLNLEKFYISALEFESIKQKQYLKH